MGIRFLDYLGDTLEHFVKPSQWAHNFESGLKDMERPIQAFRSGDAFKSLGDFAGNALELPLNTLAGAAMAYPSLKWDRPDLDKAGGFEDAANRGAGLYSSIAMMNPKLWRGGFKGMAGSLGGVIMGDALLGGAGRVAGRGLDSLTGMRPSPDELNEKFMNRVVGKKDSIKYTNPDLPDRDAEQEAVRQLLTDTPDYFNI